MGKMSKFKCIVAVCIWQIFFVCASNIEESVWLICAANSAHTIFQFAKLQWGNRRLRGCLFSIQCIRFSNIAMGKMEIAHFIEEVDVCVCVGCVCIIQLLQWDCMLCDELHWSWTNMFSDFWFDGISFPSTSCYLSSTECIVVGCCCVFCSFI